MTVGQGPRNDELLRWGNVAAERYERSAIGDIRLTPAQASFMGTDEQFVLWRDGNQLGKTFALAYWIVRFCRGEHEWQRHRPPVTVVVVGPSHEQMFEIHEKLWMLLPKVEIDCLGFDPGRGIKGKPPRVVFSSGPGKGSLILFRTYKQSTQIIAGITAHAVVCNEPPPENVFGEVAPRLFRHTGYFRAGLTPTPDSPPLDWLREKVEKGEITECNFGVIESNMWPIGAVAPWKTQAEIDTAARGYLLVERKMRIFGDWSPVVEGAWLDAFVESQHVRAFSLREVPRGSWLSGGFDHSTRPGREAFTLAAFASRDSNRPKAWFIQSIVWKEAATPEIVARDVLAELKALGLKYDDVDEWVGDRSAGEQRRLRLMQNRDIRRGFADELERPIERTKPIYTPKKWHGSVLAGLRTMNTLFSRGDAVIHSRATPLIKACKEFQGRREDPLKDPLDSARYPTERAIRGRVGFSGASVSL